MVVGRGMMPAAAQLLGLGAKPAAGGDSYAAGSGAGVCISCEADADVLGGLAGVYGGDGGVSPGAGEWDTEGFGHGGHGGDGDDAVSGGGIRFSLRSFDTRRRGARWGSRSTVVRRGGGRRFDDLTFDYNAGEADAARKEPGEGDAEDAQVASIPACVTQTRCRRFFTAALAADGGLGQPIRFPLADSMRTVTVAMKVEAKEEIKTPAGTFQTIRVEPTADEGIVKNRGRIWIWYTDDARHMPVQIRATLYQVFGTITFHLQSFEDK